jgi:hypothetical protein
MSGLLSVKWLWNGSAQPMTSMLQVSILAAHHQTKRARERLDGRPSELHTVQVKLMIFDDQ